MFSYHSVIKSYGQLMELKDETGCLSFSVVEQGLCSRMRFDVVVQYLSMLTQVSITATTSAKWKDTSYIGSPEQDFMDFVSSGMKLPLVRSPEVTKGSHSSVRYNTNRACYTALRYI